MTHTPHERASRLQPGQCPPILVISSARNLSGGLRQALYQVQALCAAGYDARLLASRGAQVFGIADNLPAHQLDGPPEHWRTQVERLLSQSGPSIVHAFHNKAVKRLAYWGLRWRLTGKPAVCVAHRGVCHRPGNPLPYILPGVDCFAPNSAACARVLARMGVGSKRLRVVNNGVPDHRVSPSKTATQLRTELDLPESALVIGSVLGENPLKGMEILLRAFAAMRRENTGDVRLLALGTKTGRWAELAAELGVADRVILPGRLNNVADYLQIFDIFVLPSQGKQDSQPNALLEALRMGVPAVASGVGGVAEALDDAGLVVPPGEIMPLSNALESLVHDPARIARLAARARVRGGFFTPRVRMEALLDLYGELLHRRGLEARA